MPNYKLTPKCIEWIKSAAKVYAERRVTQSQTGFPLTYDQVQAAILPARWRATILEMKADGVLGLNQTHDVWAKVEHPAIRRTATLRLNTPIRTLLFCRTDVELDLAVLPAETLDALVAWTNTAVSERRLANIAKAVVKDYFKDEVRSRSLAHVVARWPALAMLVGVDTGTMSHRDEAFWRTWRARFRDPPRNLKPYGWSADPWLAANFKKMRLAEIVFTSASMLPEQILNNDEIKATVRSWTPLPTDMDSP